MTKRKKHWIKWQLDGWNGNPFIFTNRYNTKKDMVEALKSMKRKKINVLAVGKNN